MTNRILSDTWASIAKFKKNPIHTVANGKGSAVAIINRNETLFYCVPAIVYEILMSKVNDKNHHEPLQKTVEKTIGTPINIITTPSKNDTDLIVPIQSEFSTNGAEKKRTIIRFYKLWMVRFRDRLTELSGTKFEVYYVEVSSPIYNEWMKCGDSPETCVEWASNYVSRLSETNPLGGDIIGPPEVMALIPIELHSTRAFTRVYLD